MDNCVVSTVADPGERPGGSAPLIFRLNGDPKEKILESAPPPRPPHTLHDLEVRILDCSMQFSDCANVVSWILLCAFSCRFVFPKTESADEAWDRGNSNIETDFNSYDTGISNTYKDWQMSTPRWYSVHISWLGGFLKPYWKPVKIAHRIQISWPNCIVRREGSFEGFLDRSLRSALQMYVHFQEE